MIGVYDTKQDRDCRNRAVFATLKKKKKKRRVREGPGMESGMKMKFKDPVIRKGSRVADF